VATAVVVYLVAARVHLQQRQAQVAVVAVILLQALTHLEQLAELAVTVAVEAAAVQQMEHLAMAVTALFIFTTNKIK
jgi:hypothetical protein